MVTDRCWHCGHALPDPPHVRLELVVVLEPLERATVGFCRLACIGEWVNSEDALHLTTCVECLSA